MAKLINHLPKPSEIPYLDTAQIFTASSIMYQTGKGKEIATFDVTIRDMPGNRNFLMLGGVEDMVNILSKWKYGADFVNYLLKEKIINKNFADYLKKFKFKGDLWTLPEGTIFFPGEPIIRVTTSLCDANLLTSFLVNVINYPTLFLSKTARVRLACNSKPFFLAGAMRAPSFEAIVKIQRYSYLIGSVIAMPYVGYHFKVSKKKPAVGFYHALIKSFKDEETAYRHFLPYMRNFGISTSMVDTYDTEKGIKHWINIEKEARKKGQSLGYVSIDSGDIFKTAAYLRKKLDDVGLPDSRIIAYYNLDEFKINILEKQGAKIDMYCPVTEVINISDRPVLEVVYKLSEIIDKQGKKTYTAKFSPGKISLPGRKQIFRQWDNNNIMMQDIIGLEDENFTQPILQQYIKSGRLIKKMPSLDEIKEYICKQLDQLPQELKDIENKVKYKVVISDNIQQILSRLKKEKT